MPWYMDFFKYVFITHMCNTHSKWHFWGIEIAYCLFVFAFVESRNAEFEIVVFAQFELNAFRHYFFFFFFLGF